MRSLVLLILTVLCHLASTQHDHGVRVGFLNLPVDHFSTTDRRNWDIRYLINDEHYVANGPIFIFIGGPEYISDEWITRGNVFDIAQETGGVLFSLEHRYFGESRPTLDASFENLQWLTIHQTVADIGRFAGFMRQRYDDAPVILFGRGYGGSLAVWARQKYPSSIDGAWGSSAPLNAIVENIDYFPNVHNTINGIGGPECTQVIADAFQMIEEAFENGNTSYVEERLRLCQPLDVGNNFDLARLQFQIAREIGENFLSHASYPFIDEKCIIMRGLDQPENPPDNALDAFARWYIDDFNRERECMYGTNEEHVRIYQEPEWDSISTLNGYRQSLWLNCVQRGAFPVANGGQGHPFGSRFDLRFFEQWCVDAFGSDM
jgi:serine protease 16